MLVALVFAAICGSPCGLLAATTRFLPSSTPWKDGISPIRVTSPAGCVSTCPALPSISDLSCGAATTGTTASPTPIPSSWSPAVWTTVEWLYDEAQPAGPGRSTVGPRRLVQRDSGAAADRVSHPGRLLRPATGPVHRGRDGHEASPVLVPGHPALRRGFRRVGERAAMGILQGRWTWFIIAGMYVIGVVCAMYALG